jgi:hypothetical protein
VARAAEQADNIPARAIQAFGRATAAGVDSCVGAFDRALDGMRARARRAEEERKREERSAWLREHTKASKIFVPDGR